MSPFLVFSACTTSQWTFLCPCYFLGWAWQHTAMLRSLCFKKHLTKLFREKILQKQKVLLLWHHFWWAEQLCAEEFKGRSRSVRRKVDSCQQYNHFQIALVSKAKPVISLSHSSHKSLCHCFVRRLLHCCMGTYRAFSSDHMGLMDDSALKGRVHPFIRNLGKRLCLMIVPQCHL